MGSHLSRNVQRGRWRDARGLPEDVVGVVGRPRRGRLAEPGGQVAFEAVVRGHAICLRGPGSDPPRERDPHRGEGSVEAGLRGAERDAEGLGDRGTDIPT